MCGFAAADPGKSVCDPHICFARSNVILRLDRLKGSKPICPALAFEGKLYACERRGIRSGNLRGHAVDQNIDRGYGPYLQIELLFPRLPNVDNKAASKKK